MVLIEMHLSNPGARSQYIWSLGQPWPVPVAEDPYVTRVEAFGPELEALKNVLPAGRLVGGVQDWLPNVAPSISEQMRIYASKSVS